MRPNGATKDADASATRFERTRVIPPTQAIQEDFMSMHRNSVPLAALALAMAAAMPAPASAQDSVTVIKGDHHYIYYRDHDIYFAPDTRTYYWMDHGAWQSGPTLPPDEQRYISSGGVDIQLDTARSYERNDYV